MNNTKVNIWLDDERPAPENWIHVKSAQECIELLELHKGNVDNLSLDHDIGDEKIYGTGNHVAVWLEKQAFFGYKDYIPQNITVHSQNCSRSGPMKIAIANCKKYLENNK